MASECVYYFSLAAADATLSTSLNCFLTRGDLTQLKPTLADFALFRHWVSSVTHEPPLAKTHGHFVEHDFDFQSISPWFPEFFVIPCYLYVVPFVFKIVFTPQRFCILDSDWSEGVHTVPRVSSGQSFLLASGENQPGKKIKREREADEFAYNRFKGMSCRHSTALNMLVFNLSVKSNIYE